MMVTPKVREEARRHFNCSDLEGAELESQGGSGAAFAHWDERAFQVVINNHEFVTFSNKA